MQEPLLIGVERLHSAQQPVRKSVVVRVAAGLVTGWILLCLHSGDAQWGMPDDLVELVAIPPAQPSDSTDLLAHKLASGMAGMLFDRAASIADMENMTLAMPQSRLSQVSWGAVPLTPASRLAGRLRRAPIPPEHSQAERSVLRELVKAEAEVALIGASSALLQGRSQSVRSKVAAQVASIDTIAQTGFDESVAAEFDKMEEEALALDPSCFKPTRGPDGRLQPVLTLPGDTLETTPFMTLMTSVATTVFLGTVVRAFAVGDPVWAFISVIGGALAGEMFSGAFHWATDNYGDIETPVVGFACAAFQGHHLAPWTISHRGFVNNVHKIAGATIPLSLGGSLLLSPTGAGFFATMLYCQVLAQEFHRWTHMPPKTLEAWQKKLQTAGLALPFGEHLAHHKPPFDRKYCILNGQLNGILDSEPVLFWRRLEAIVYRINGVEPLSWKDPRCKVKALRTLPLASQVPPPPEGLSRRIAKASEGVYLKLLDGMSAPRDERQRMVQELRSAWHPDGKVAEQREIAKEITRYLNSVGQVVR